MESSIRLLNVTVVYDKLDRDSIPRNLLRNAMGEGCNIIDLPPALLLVIPTLGANAQLDDKHLRINVPVEGQIENPLDLLIRLSTALVPLVGGSSITAYGFNFDGIESGAKDNVRDLITDVFLPHKEELSRQLGGKIISLEPGFAIEYEGYLFSIRLSPSSGGLVSFHANVHFEETAFPPAGKLRESAHRSQGLFYQLLWKIIGKDA